MIRDTVDMLRRQSISPSAQRVAIAEYVLSTNNHPTAAFTSAAATLLLWLTAALHTALNPTKSLPDRLTRTHITRR